LYVQAGIHYVCPIDVTRNNDANEERNAIFVKRTHEGVEEMGLDFAHSFTQYSIIAEHSHAKSIYIQLYIQLKNRVISQVE
jgi:hypothetical protein